VILSHAPPCSCKSKGKEKEKKRNINNDLAVLPSHDTGALLSYGDHPPTYAQIYILDIAEKLNIRRLNNRNLDPVVIDNLQTMLLDNHLYIGHYCHAYELIREKPVEEQKEITIRLHVNLQQDQRTHNLPTAEEIAVIIPEEGVYHAIDNRDENAKQREGEERAHSQCVSDTCYYIYHLHVREDPQPPLFYGRKLFQQFVVDAWANCKQRKLN